MSASGADSGHQQRKQHVDKHREQGKVEGVVQNLPPKAGVPQFMVIGKANIALCLAHDLPVIQADLQATQNRPNQKDQKDGKMGQDKEIVGQLLAHLLPTVILFSSAKRQTGSRHKVSSQRIQAQGQRLSVNRKN